MGKRGFWQAAVSLDGTHAQWRTFISLTPVFILPMVGYSHGLLIFLRHRAAAIFFSRVGTLRWFSSRREQREIAVCCLGFSGARSFSCSATVCEFPY